MYVTNRLAASGLQHLLDRLQESSWMDVTHDFYVKGILAPLSQFYNCFIHTSAIRPNSGSRESIQPVSPAVVMLLS